MAFDGITVAALTAELSNKLKDGRIFKIAQPEADTLILTIKVEKQQYKLLLSANASLPLLYLTTGTWENPITAPNFCMLLRKHIQNGRIVRIWQPDLERIVHFEISHYDELGDLCQKTLTIELMGKHSNIIFQEESHTIIDSIKHVSASMSSVREVLPGRPYFIPDTMKKVSPITIKEAEFVELLKESSQPLYKMLYTHFTGISPTVANEICDLAALDCRFSCNKLEKDDMVHLYRIFAEYLAPLKAGTFTPVIYYKQDEPVEYCALPLHSFKNHDAQAYDSISALLETYYTKREQFTRMRHKSADLRRIVQTALEKDYKKYDLQCRQLKDTQKRDKYKVYGELITTYGYQVPAGSNTMEALNYYTNEMITIPLDGSISPIENAKKYFERYQKLKRTYEALTEITETTKASISHLESIATALDMAPDENSIKEIREELVAYGYIKPHYKKTNRKGKAIKKEKIISKPLHYVTSDGYHLYVGKNNYQNEELTFRFATGNDWWFHAKGIPGSHVILKTTDTEIPDHVFEQAAALAAYYSKGQEQEKVDIDYIQKKHVKKANGGAPGFVIYHTNYSMTITPDIKALTQLS